MIGSFVTATTARKISADGRDQELSLTKRRKATETSAFGASRRESHDATKFYSRFAIPLVSDEDTINPPVEVDVLYCGDARRMDEVAPGSVALVVTSPPYFAGKEYEQGLGDDHVPGTYLEYLQMLHDVFSQCVHKLESGGRIAVNVANLGRRPYRSLASDVITILQDDLGLLLRGEIVWQKARGAGGSCAWGSFQSATNPVLRDVTERVIVAGKGRFDRARSKSERMNSDLPWETTIFKDDFMEATLDLWDIAPESATRVGHPAPFPVELPQRLIELYTYKGDLVLDPFMGSGSTAVAAVRTGRHYVGYDTDESYLESARERIELERERLAPAGSESTDESLVTQALRARASAKEIAYAALTECGFVDVSDGERLLDGLEVSFSARDRQGRRWLFLLAGGITATRNGLRRGETLWSVLGKAAVLNSSMEGDYRLVLLTTELPPPGTAANAALRSARGQIYFDAIDILSAEDRARLAAHASDD